MAYVITSLCLRDGACVEVCPVECIVPGKPVDEWPLYYIDPETCIDCGACVPECPLEAIFPEDEVPSDYEAKGGEKISMPAGTEGFDEVYDGTDHNGDPVHLEHVKTLEPGEIVDLTPAIEWNRAFFEEGPGYSALED